MHGIEIAYDTLNRTDRSLEQSKTEKKIKTNYNSKRSILINKQGKKLKS